jgi:hypothetical protein
MCCEPRLPLSRLTEAELLAAGVALPLFGNVLRWIKSYAGVEYFHRPAAQWALSL